MSPKVSIIVPVYNVEKYLRQCLDSLLSQTLKEIEIICVNDGSTDSSPKMLKEYAKKDQRIKIINKPNGGLSSARNAGMEAAKGEYIGFVDSDDWVEKEMYQKMYTRAKITNSDMVLCQVSLHGEDSEISGMEAYYSLAQFPNFLDNKVFKPSDTYDYLFNISVTAVDKIYKRDFLKRIRASFPVGLHFEDNPFFYESYMQAKRVTLVREPLYIYRIQKGGITGTAGAHFCEMLEIQNIVIKIFRKIGKYKKFETELFNNKAYSIWVRYNALQVSERKAFLKLIKKDFQKLPFPKKVLNTINPGAKIFYEKIINTPINGKVVNQLSTLELGLRLNQKYLTRMLKKLIRQIRDIKFLGLPGLFKIFGDIFRLLKKIVRGALVPIKNYLGNNLTENQRRVLKYLFKLEFLRIKKVVKNEKWEGPLVTVVTTFFNQSDTILETIESVLNQTFINYEYIIVNDGSRPEERKILDKIQDPRLKIIDTEHRGFGSPAAARNRGLTEGRGKYFMCLDGDDLLNPRYLEKCLIVLETNPNIDIATTDMEIFGARTGEWRIGKFYPQLAFRRNMVAAPSLYRAEFYKKSGGVKEGIGYEDWEYWVNLIGHGALVHNLGEKLILYRAAMQSRYIEDNKKHYGNFKKIASLHPWFRLRVFLYQVRRFFIKKVINPSSAFINLKSKNFNIDVSRPHVLIALPTMTIGGAEKLTLNFSEYVSKDFEITFITGIYSDNPWEKNFRSVSENIYHLSNLFNSKDGYLVFLDWYIKSRRVKVFHLIHSSFAFSLLESLKNKNPELKVIYTVFNDKVNYFKDALNLKGIIDIYQTDNPQVVESLAKSIESSKILLLKSGVDAFGLFNPKKYTPAKHAKIRTQYGISDKDYVVSNIGRFSDEKNHQFIVEVAKRLKDKKIIFVLVGNGPLKKKVQKSACGLNNIIFIDSIESAADMLSITNLFFLPSKVEGTPNVLLEAMAMEVPVLAAPVGGIPAVVEDRKDGFVIDNLGPTEVARKILEIKSGGSAVGVKARQKILENYTLEKMAKNYKKMYCEDV